MRFNTFSKEAEACGKLVKEWLFPTKKFHRRDVSADVIYMVARWAGHWASLELARKT